MNRLPDLTDLLPAEDLADTTATAALAAGVYRIGPRRCRRLVPDRALRLTVLSGRLWLTTAGDDRDRFPGPGEDLALPAGTDVTLEADGPASAVVVLEDVALPRARLSLLDHCHRLLARLRHAAALRRDLRELEGLSPERLADIGIDGRIARTIWLRRHLTEAQTRLDALRY